MTFQIDIQADQPEGIPPVSEKYQIGDWTLPGQGEAYSDCGELRFRGCLHVGGHHGGEREGKAFVKGYYRSCNRKQCPKCYEKWASLEASRAVYRLLHFCASKKAIERVYLIKDDEKRYLAIEGLFAKAKRKPIHVVFSVPKRFYSENITRLRPRMYKLSQKSGLYGGCAIFHPYRERKKLKTWYFSPHFHVVGFGWVRNVKYLYEHYGWIIKNIGLRKTVHGTLFYQLSHAGVHKDHHVVTWFGRLSYNKLRVEPVPVLKPSCPLCERPLIELVWCGSLDRPPPDKEGVFWLSAEDWAEKHTYANSYYSPIEGPDDESFVLDPPVKIVLEDLHLESGPFDSWVAKLREAGLVD
jgi:hypothetical protein